MFRPPTIGDVRQALNAVEGIERPDADNDGDSLNSPSVYDNLSKEDQEKVDHAEETLRVYVRNPAGEPNNKALRELNKNGFSASFNQDQYDSYRYVGRVSIGDWTLDISDPSSGDDS